MHKMYTLRSTSCFTIPFLGDLFFTQKNFLVSLPSRSKHLEYILRTHNFLAPIDVLGQGHRADPVARDSHHQLVFS